MGLELTSPFVLASLTLFSNISLSKHIQFYKRAVGYGAGAIILPSVNPQRRGDGDHNKVIVETRPIESGIDKGMMGFSVLGPTFPNIISVDYGVNLAHGLITEEIEVPILGSVANMGNPDEIIEAVRLLVESGIHGIELNFSCPNVITKNKSENIPLSIISLPPLSLLENIRHICNDIPISLKLSPFIQHEQINNLEGYIDGLTISNAYTGLMPPVWTPDCTTSFESPFFLSKDWAPTGIYGPQERLMTYYTLYKCRQIKKEKGIDISCVGGIVTKEQAIQALLLGADTVQLSSVIAWKGMSVFKEFADYLEMYLIQNEISCVEDICGLSLSHIKESIDEAVKTKVQTRKMEIDSLVCHNCKECRCCEGLCIAFDRKKNNHPVIDRTLCSGCGWCKFKCPHKAVKEIE